MQQDDDNERRLREFLKRSENPYARLQVFVTNKESEYLRKLQNPYAKLSIYDQPEDDGLFVDAQPQTAIASAAKSLVPGRRRPDRPVATKMRFRNRCRFIFSQYMPTIERGQLRPHHKDFIERNSTRSSYERAEILHHLERYDLSQLKGLSTQFNRERDEITVEKLQAIERLVGESESGTD